MRWSAPTASLPTSMETVCQHQRLQPCARSRRHETPIIRRSSKPMNHTLYRLSCLPATLGAVALLGAPVRADLTMDITPTSALPGGSGAFDVTLADVSGSFNVGGFTFELSVPGGSGVTFTNASMSTGGTYIFAGNSFDTANSLPFSLNSFPTTDVAASDAANTGGTPMI